MDAYLVSEAKPTAIYTAESLATEQIDSRLSSLKSALFEQVGRNLHKVGPEYVSGLEQYTASLKQYYGNRHGNTINYVTQLLEASSTAWSDLDHNVENYLGEVEAEVFKNELTAVVEHPIAESVGYYRGVNEWMIDEYGRKRIKTAGGYLDEIVMAGVNDETGQVPEFEKKRNYHDLRALEILTKTRSGVGKIDTAVSVGGAVEKASRVDGNIIDPYAKVINFSPSPTNLDDPEVRARGYQGNDQIKIFELDDNGNEVTNIYWFPGVDIEEYKQLAKELLMHSDNDELAGVLRAVSAGIADSDGALNAMYMTACYNEKQVSIIKNFIDKKQADSAGHNPIIENFIDKELSRKVKSEVLSRTYEAALLLARPGITHEKFDEALEEIYRIISDLQLQLRMYIHDVAGKDTFANKEISKKLGYRGVSYEDYTAMNWQSRREFMQDINFSANGCGFSGGMGGGFGSGFGGGVASGLATANIAANGFGLWGNPGIMGIALVGMYPPDFGMPHHGRCGKEGVGCGNYTVVGGCDLCVDCHLKIAQES